MCTETLLNQNLKWSEVLKESNPELLSTLAEGQSPKYLWIGCSDSRVPETTIAGMLPGDIFVHRNIANLVKHVDISCQSVMQYAIDVLKVEHVIVCGHYSCGGVMAAMGNVDAGIVDNWLRDVKDSCVRNNQELSAIEDDGERFARMCELNVMDQVENVVTSKIVQNAWKRGQKLEVHGWIYSIKNGLLKDLGISRDSNSTGDDIYKSDG